MCCFLSGCTACSKVKSSAVLTENDRFNMSEEWRSYLISGSSNGNRETALANLRNKILKHNKSQSHQAALKNSENVNQDVIGTMIYGSTPPKFLFLELVELENQTAGAIEEALLNCLNNAGFSDEWLKENWIAFVSDGASVMLGKNAGVATRLTARYP